MFLAIINDTYAEVKSELADSNDEFAIMDYFKSHYQNLLGKLGKQQDQIDGIQAALKVSSDSDTPTGESNLWFTLCNHVQSDCLLLHHTSLLCPVLDSLERHSSVRCVLLVHFVVFSCKQSVHPCALAKRERDDQLYMKSMKILMRAQSLVKSLTGKTRSLYVTLRGMWMHSQPVIWEFYLQPALPPSLSLDGI